MCVSNPPQWIVMTRVPRLAASRCAAVRRRVESVLVFGYAAVVGVGAVSVWTRSYVL